MPLGVVVNPQLGRKLALLREVPPEICEPLDILRFLKKQFPDEYRAIWYELVPQNQGLILPGGSDGRHTGSAAYESLKID